MMTAIPEACILPLPVEPAPDAPIGLVRRAGRADGRMGAAPVRAKNFKRGFAYAAECTSRPTSFRRRKTMIA
jgi:hypothetical protein